MSLTSKQRAYLKSLSNHLNAAFQIGKNSITPEYTKAIDETLEKNELIKLGVLKNCMDDPRELAEMLAERTHSEVVMVIGKKIILYRESKEKKKIVLPRD